MKESSLSSVSVTPPLHVEPPSWLSEVEAQLEALCSVPDNWDGYGGASPRPDAVAAARHFTLGNSRWDLS